MNVTFRVDASVDIGIGHVVRCLTLANALQAMGANSRFVCRPHQGHLIEHVRERGFEVLSLPSPFSAGYSLENSYAGWLGASWRDDAEQTVVLLNEHGTRAGDWLVVDHYGIDQRWETVVSSGFRRLMVVDDLANREHICDLLLDQTYGRQSADYKGLVANHCELLCGIEHVLLRSEFDALRQKSLDRRIPGSLKRILVSLGGVDKSGLSGRVISALDKCGLPPDAEIKVVVGSGSPSIKAIRRAVDSISVRAELILSANNMAELLTWSDLAVGAAGTSSWERCYLGVPTALLVLADNQREIAARLSDLGAVWPINSDVRLESELTSCVEAFLSDTGRLSAMSDKARRIVMKSGAETVAQKMLDRLV